ncbi:hypothetical protein SPF06_18580 [Sinomonas sp. JGH33]|uniref:Uncharacterized protein n=1 Tax=Sinomonas terricola TaxID=3110330 RepID=A0ABU5TB65_9MICC|nr:hypothetical protein [Sinomonas sp. JGH33]MEA5456734.1 hypothetical protein [Sinomonas sp. JGH33]
MGKYSGFDEARAARLNVILSEATKAIVAAQSRKFREDSGSQDEIDEPDSDDDEQG